MTEPDRQRLARFTLDAVETLGGNIFAAAAALNAPLGELRDEGRETRMPITVDLEVEGDEMRLVWGERPHPLIRLRQAPEPQAVTALAEQLRQASEATDSAFLAERNRQISAALEHAKKRAQDELAELEEALERKKTELTESLQRAQTDSLTGLYNRGAYDERLHEAFLRCQRQHEPLCLLLLDVDHFKEINDTHGHQQGDEYLKGVAAAMRSATRSHVDIPCRMGGDEFAIVLFADLELARRVADDILRLTAGKVSIGVTSLATDDTVAALIGRADGALYEAKRRGRGQAVVAGEPRRERRSAV